MSSDRLVSKHAPVIIAQVVQALTLQKRLDFAGVFPDEAVMGSRPILAERIAVNGVPRKSERCEQTGFIPFIDHHVRCSPANINVDNRPAPMRSG